MILPRDFQCTGASADDRAPFCGVPRYGCSNVSKFQSLYFNGNEAWFLNQPNNNLLSTKYFYVQSNKLFFQSNYHLLSTKYFYVQSNKVFFSIKLSSSLNQILLCSIKQTFSFNQKCYYSVKH